MYLPGQFAAEDAALIARAAAEEPFALLLSNGGGVPAVSHVPVLLETAADGARVVHGHLARANPHRDTLRDGDEVLVVFNGPHAYVSPSWYRSTAVVPTWNYIAVHMRGSIELRPDRESNRAIVDRLTATFEAGRTPPWAVDYGHDAVEQMLDHIVSFRVVVHVVEAKFKLSQNRPAADRDGVVEALASGNETERTLARWMRIVNGAA